MSHGTLLGLLTVLAAGLPGMMAAIFGYLGAKRGKDIREQLETGNGKTVGEMVKEAHEGPEEK